MNLWPYEDAPAFIFSILKGIGSLPNTATNQWIGLAKAISPLPHRMALGNLIPIIIAGRISRSISFVFLPFISFLAQIYSPFSVLTIFKSFTFTPCAFAKPSAAFVGLLFSSKAVLFAGPVISTTVSGCFSSSPPAWRTNLLGVPIVRTLLKAIRLSSMDFLKSLSMNSSAPGINPAGISSVPISSSRSFAIVYPYMYRIPFLPPFTKGEGGGIASLLFMHLKLREASSEPFFCSLNLLLPCR